MCIPLSKTLMHLIYLIYIFILTNGYDDAFAKAVSFEKQLSKQKIR